MAEAKKVAEVEGIKQAQVLRRWLRQKSGVDSQKINFDSAPPRISMGADLAVGSDYGATVVTKDGEVVSETYTGLSGTPVNIEPFRPKPIDEKRRLVLDAVATVGGKVTVASEIPAPEPKSSNCSECGGFNGNHFRGCKKGK